MPSNSFSTILDKTQRLTHTLSSFPRSKSSRTSSSEALPQQQPTKRHSSLRTEERSRNMTSKYNANTRSTIPIRSVSGPSRFSPVVRTPDELFLRTLERRAANQARESQRRRSEPYNQTDEAYLSVAIACSLPPDYFEHPPDYASPLKFQRTLNASTYLPSRSQVSVQRGDELFLEPLHAEIDETILQFSSENLPADIPATIPFISTHAVSPVSALDHDYLAKIERWVG